MSKKESSRKNHRLQILVTQETAEHVHQVATEQGISVSEWVGAIIWSVLSEVQKVPTAKEGRRLPASRSTELEWEIYPSNPVAHEFFKKHGLSLWPVGDAIYVWGNILTHAKLLRIPAEYLVAQLNLLPDRCAPKQLADYMNQLCIEHAHWDESPISEQQKS